ncbi:hypothetical protein PR202_gb29917 [Eleusine coracana subsp. coracana]|uniref:O-fucosyltransferase family protein n=1 Tax=Eleusine coracana subsp. coracana TaxID=191504 RepID=A0AAV5G041_ELECO|nr:hypothetical protein PR202_gb29917 [Eleusine coracana subsp. coracana]
MRRGLSSETLLRRHRGPARLWVGVAVLVTGTIWLWSSNSVVLLGAYRVQIQMVGEHLLHHAPIGLICNAVVVARIMNATLVLPELDTNSFWHDESNFVDIYDVPHFIKTLKYDVRIVTSVPKITAQGKTKKLRTYKIEPPRDAPVTWYRTTALEKIRKCIDIFTPKEQEILLKYREEHFRNKTLVYRRRKLIGKCPLTPEEIYLASGKLFCGKRFMKPFKAMFPRLENHSMVGNGKPEENIGGLAGKALAPIFMDMEEGHASGYEERIRKVMFNTHFGAPHTRIHPESFYTNSWPECFCQMKARNHADQRPPNNVNNVLKSQFQNKENIEAEATNQTDSTSQIPELAGGTELAKVY